MPLTMTTLVVASRHVLSVTSTCEANADAPTRLNCYRNLFYKQHLSEIFAVEKFTVFPVVSFLVGYDHRDQMPHTEY